MPSEQEEAQESFMFNFFRFPIAKIKVNKYNKNAPNHLNSVNLTLGQNDLILPFAHCFSELKHLSQVS